MKQCNHVWQIDGKVLPRLTLEERVKQIPKGEYAWLRKDESSKGYEICLVCKNAVRLKGE